MNYKRYVGGKWEESSKAQLELMIKNGLKKEHKLLDIGCGAFRGGKLFIDYLDKGNYYGIDKHKWLVDAGINNEIYNYEEKQPNIIVNDCFDFSQFNTKFDFAIATSVFTHLKKDKIKQCLDNLLEHTSPNFILYASIFKGDSSENPIEDNDNKRFKYRINEIRELSDKWNVEYDERYLRQIMLKFTKRK